MFYIVFEMQTNSDGTLGTLVTTYNDRLAAESAYHAVLAAAAVSALPRHGAMLVTNTGVTVLSQTYAHEPAPEPNAAEPEANEAGDNA